ncbi:MAG: carboxypeptidase-like regulatory domain-containing protein, partial [Saprospiraceae bacterium]|nr:carboxypeptidase-like regulatory domain-containing protein [Saprospiraceae bacterium]
MPNTLIQYCKILFALFLIVGAPLQSIYAQKTTTVIGKVFDAKTEEPLPFVDVVLKGTYVGASTDLDGRFEIKTKFASDTIVVSFLGYQTLEQPINMEERQVLNFYLEEEGILMESVTIVEKKGRYRKKNNPAVELMRKVIENRDRNKLEAQDYYNYDKHEKLELDLNNITEQFKESRGLKSFDFLWNYLDTSEVNGRVYLPLYMRETLSSVHYRKDPEVKKERRHAVKMTEFDEALDMESISNVIDLLYQDVNLYDNHVKLLDN